MSTIFVSSEKKLMRLPVKSQQQSRSYLLPFLK